MNVTMSILLLLSVDMPLCTLLSHLFTFKVPASFILEIGRDGCKPCKPPRHTHTSKVWIQSRDSSNIIPRFQAPRLHFRPSSDRDIRDGARSCLCMSRWPCPSLAQDDQGHSSCKMEMRAESGCFARVRVSQVMTNSGTPKPERGTVSSQ